MDTGGASGSRRPLYYRVTQWNWDNQYYRDDPELNDSKRTAYLRYLDLPRLSKRPFEIAANIDPADVAGDRHALEAAGWRLVHPHEVAGDPERYRSYIRESRGEISCAKPIFRLLRTGWLSDRSACFLASGRPVVAEETGASDHFDTGHGLVTFRDMDEAVAAVQAIDANYETHSRAAREFAERYLSHEVQIPQMLNASCD